MSFKQFRCSCVVLLVFALSLASLSESVAAREKLPNVVLILTDNHGAWTLGCYGNRDIRTPNIDRLAQEGTLFTRAFASNPVCSPTRATLLTGLMPSQHGVHCFLVGGRLQVGPQARNTLDQFRSLPEILHDQGYSCGLVGKWHLGDNLNPQEGFDDYWITMPHGGTSTFYDAPIIENGKIRKESEYLTDFWTRHAVNFIDRSSKKEKPFFLMLAYNGPYALGRLLLREGRNRHAQFYADKELLSFPREPTHPWQFSNRDYHNNPVSNRRVATEVSGVDDGVGTVLEALKNNGLDENTVVVFVADQGWVGGHGGFYGMGDHTRPLTARDGMMQIPMIWRHPQGIAAGKRSNRMITNYDFMPTLLSYLGLDDQMPSQPKSPGGDFSHEFQTTKKKRSDNDNQAIYYEFENLRCVRTERWKYVHRHPNGPHELYDLTNDPNEFDNLVVDKDHAATRNQLKLQLDAFFKKYASPKYDLWRGGGSQTRIFDGIEEEFAQVEPAEPPPLTEGFSAQKIKVPEGFTVELAAGPPLVSHPTFATFDDRGRLFVCENAGVNLTAQDLEAQLPNSIRLLEDNDNDGRFDKSTVFADKMTFPMGGAWHNGALYVASPPSIWRLEDTTGNGVADKRDVIVNMFGYTGNAASIHGCFFGPDGRLYWCDGYHGHEIKDGSGNVISQRKGSYIFSSKPDGSDVRLHSGGGMDNPVELDFTDEGELLGTVNILYTRPRVDALVHWLHGGAYPHREQVLSEIKITGDLLGPVHRFGHVAVSGTMRYRSGVMDHRWRDNMFATFFNRGKVVRLETERDGSSFSVTQREFLSCNNRDFHPTDVVEDADGSLLVVDTGGWFYRGCPTSQHEKPEILGGIYRIRRSRMTTLPDSWGKRINWSKQTNNDLVHLLNDTRIKVQERAIAECAKRRESIVGTLQQTVRIRDIRQRQNAIWALTRIVGDEISRDSAGDERGWVSQARAAIRSALSDQNFNIRLTACRSLATYPDQLSVEQLLQLVNNDEPAIRREAASAVGCIGDKRAVPSLLKALENSIDRSEEHALIFALIEIADTSTTRTGLTSTNTNTQRGALIAIDQIDNGDLAANDILPLIESSDPRLQQTAVKVFCSHADWADDAAEVLEVLLARSQYNESAIRLLVTTFVAEQSVSDLIGRRLNDSTTSSEIKDLLLNAIAQKQNAPLNPSWVTPLQRMLESDDARAVRLAMSAVAALKPEQFKQQLNNIASDESKPDLLRVDALQIASGNRNRLTESAFELLVELLNSGGPRESVRAAQKLGASSLTTSQTIQLAPKLTAAGPSQLRELLRPFQRSGDAEIAKAFLTAMKDARGLTYLAPHEFSDVIKRYPREWLPKANVLLARVQQEEAKKLARIDKLIPLLKDGDATRGRKLFFAEKTKCATCHRVGNKGGKIGPDLTTIGANRAAQDLLESIVFPSATFVRDYEPQTVLTTDGRVFSGLIVRESNIALHIQQQTGDPIILSRDEIDEVSSGTVSIMPNGLEKALSKTELADVVAYLSSLKQ